MASVYQQTPLRDMTQDKFSPYCGDDKYYYISVRLGHMIKACQTMWPEIRTTVSLRREKKIEKKDSKKPGVAY